MWGGGGVESIWNDKTHAQCKAGQDPTCKFLE